MTGIKIAVEAEDSVHKDRYSNNGSCPTWCFNSTCLVRVGKDVFVSATERVPGARPLSDCRWVLMRRTDDGWERIATDPGRTREPSPLAVLPPGRLLLSANPTLTGPRARGGGPARPSILAFDPAGPAAPYKTLLPDWQGRPRFSEHSYRTFVADAASGEMLLFQNAGYSHSEWALLTSGGKWIAGKLKWPPYAKTDLAPYGARFARVNYPVVVLRNRAVHFCGVPAYDNWDRVRTVKDLGLGKDPNAPGQSGSGGRMRGNRMRRLVYAWTEKAGEKPFHAWVEIDNSFADGGWLFAGDAHLDAAGTLHMLWTHCPMLPSVRNKLYKDIKRVYRIKYATIRNGKVVTRRTLVTAPEPAVLTDPGQVGRPYVLLSGERILGDGVPTPRFHVTPNGRLFVVYYIYEPREKADDLSENRILEILPNGRPSKHAVIPLKHPLFQFFTATPRAGNAPSWTLDLFGHRRGGWTPREGAGFREYDGAMSYARIRLKGE